MPSPSSLSTQGLRRTSIFLIIIGLLAAGIALTLRIRAERSAAVVDLVVDANEVVSLAGLQGVSVGDAFTQLQQAGVTTVALPEDTLATLGEQGKVVFLDRAQAPALFAHLPAGWHAEDEMVAVRATDPSTDLQVRQGLARVYAAANIHAAPEGMLVRGAHAEVEELGLGLAPARVRQIAAAGLRVTPRLQGGDWTTPAVLRASLEAIAGQLPPAPAGQPRGLVIFDGTTIPGYRALIPQLAGELNRQRLVYGSVEFGKQRGDAALGSKLRGRLVRVHSVSQEEIANLQPGEIVQRFALAVKDRNIRALYVHLPMQAVRDPLADSAKYVRAIAGAVRDEGFVISSTKAAHPFTPLSLPAPLLALLFVGAVGSTLFWVLSVLPAQLPRQAVVAGYVLLALGILGSFGLALVRPAEGRMLFGLLAAIGFPMIALIWAYRQVDRLTVQRPANALVSAVAVLLVATVITLAGGLIVAATMADSRYLVKVGQFAGVKLALALPLLLLGAIIVSDGLAKAGESFPAYVARCRARLQAFLGQPIYLWGIIAAVVGLVVVALVLARSGNDAGVGVSATELHMRSLLEQWLVARPRTKEFLFGFPLFLFSMVSAARGRRTLALALLLGGAIGQVDVLNTYCHAHTPVLLSLLRTFNGLWLGTLIGGAAVLLFGSRQCKPVESETAVA